MKSLGLWCAALLATGAWAQSAVVDTLQGSAAVSIQGDSEWMELAPRRGLRSGDRVWTDKASRVQLSARGHSLRLDSLTRAGIDVLAASATRLSLRRGSIAADVGVLAERENFEIGTPNLAFRATSPGRFRIDVDAQRDVTQVAVLEGAGLVFGEGGDSRELKAGERMTFAGRALARAGAARAAQADDFDRWVPASSRAAARTPVPRPRALAHASAQRAREKFTQRETVRAPRHASIDAWQREQEDWMRYQNGLPPRWRR